MSAISSVGGLSSAWPDPGATRAAAMKERMFAKVDTDGSGGVDKTEMRALLEHMSQQSGQAVGDAEALLTQMDSDSDGSLSSDELDAGMKSLLPPPSSTMEFAQRRVPEDGEPPPPPPPDEATSTTAAAASETSNTSYDPLDTNEDGVVSAQERMAGAVQALLTAMDTDGDKAIGASEVDSFINQLGEMMRAAYSHAAANGASTTQVDVAA